MWGWLDPCQHLIFFIPGQGGTRFQQNTLSSCCPQTKYHQLSLTLLRRIKKAISYRVRSLICFLLYKVPLCMMLILELHDSIVFDVAVFYFRPPSPLLWFCSFQWESSSWQHCSTMLNSSGTSTRRLLDNPPTKLGH